MSEWCAGVQAASRVKAWAQAGDRLFSSAEWGDVLASLGCQPRFAWSEKRGEGVLVPVFRRGPLRVGFLGFPVVTAGLAGHSTLPMAEVSSALGLDVLRVNQPLSMDGVPADHGGIIQPDAWIDDLANWREQDSKRRARDLAHARRASRGLTFVDGPCEPGELYRLYEAVVRAHRGTVRYSAPYFERLLALPGHRIRVLHALDARGALAGAAVLAMDQGTGYYLHAAVSAMARPLGLSDELLSRLISLARDRGLSRFNLMASPANQPGLLRFKAKWSDRAGVVLTRDYGRGWLGRAAVMINAAISARRR